MKIACVYHKADLDGWMSAAIIKHWFLPYSPEIDVYDYNNTLKINYQYLTQKELHFIGYDYGNPVPDLSEYNKIIMVDVSFSVETMIDLIKKYGEKFIWIDHHQRIINEVVSENKDNLPYEGLVTTPDGVKYAACELTWMYFFPDEPIPEIVRLLGMYDSFRHKDTDEDQKVLWFQYGARGVINNYDRAYYYLLHTLGLSNWNHDISNPIRGILYSGAEIYGYLCVEAKETYKNGFPLLLIEHKDNVTVGEQTKIFICFNSERFNPINFGIDYHKDGYDGAACFWYQNGKWKFSLYNDNGLVDVSVIAKQYGGGGHKGASGFVVNDLSTIINETNKLN